MIWETIDRLSYFGKKRDAIHNQFDLKYGAGNWRLAWQFGGQALPFPIAIQIYEDSYYEYLKMDKALLNQLLDEARDVYDNDETNVNCGLDYSIQENNSNHYQDISVRRVVLRLGRTFKGDSLVQIRHKSESEVGALLSPGRVPFHLPEMTVKPVQEGWWEKSTVEEFWQSNKVLQIKKVEMN